MTSGFRKRRTKNINKMFLDKSEKHMYVFANSSEDDKPFQFVAKLPSTIHLDNTWSVALVDIIWKHTEQKESSKKSLRMYIESELVQPTCVGTTYRPIIGTVPLVSLQYRRQGYAPHSRIYKPISINASISEFDVYIKDDHNQLMSHLTGVVSVQLHFKRY